MRIFSEMITHGGTWPEIRNPSFMDKPFLPFLYESDIFELYASLQDFINTFIPKITKPSNK